MVTWTDRDAMQFNLGAASIGGFVRLGHTKSTVLYAHEQTTLLVLRVV